MKRRMSLLIICLLLCTFILPACAKSDKVNTAIDAALLGYQKGTNTIFHQDILDGAGQGAEWLVFAASRAGHKDNYSQYLNALDNYFQENLKSKEHRDAALPTDLHRIALGILSAGGDPMGFSSDENGEVINFIEEGIYNRCVTDENGIRTGTLGEQGTNGFAWALLILDTYQYDVPVGALYTRDEIIVAILATQNEDGGFAIYGAESDNDMTATTITALAPYYGEREDVKVAIDKALELLMTQQQDDGDFKNTDFPDFPGAANSVTTAQVLTALSALGVDVQTDSRFIQNGNTILDGLLKYQKQDGTFAYDLNDMEEASFGYGSEQVLYALVAYQRFAENQTSLFDFSDGHGTTELAFLAKGKEYTINFDKSKTTYEVDLPEDITEIEFSAIPLSPYEAPRTEIGQPIAYQGMITFDVMGRYQNTTYTIKTRLPELNISLNEAIHSLPDVLSEEDFTLVQKIFMHYENLPMEERSLIANYPELQEKYLAYIQNKNLNYVTSGTFEEMKYTITINGTDIVAPVAFDTQITSSSAYEQNIHQISQDAFIVHFEHSGELPGNTSVELKTDLQSGNYELYHYNPETKTGDIVDTIEVFDGVVQFSIDSCSDYYLTWLNSGSTANPSSGYLWLLVLTVVFGLGTATMIYYKKRGTN